MLLLRTVGRGDDLGVPAGQAPAGTDRCRETPGAASRVDTVGARPQRIDPRARAKSGSRPRRGAAFGGMPAAGVPRGEGRKTLNLRVVQPRAHCIMQPYAALSMGLCGDLQTGCGLVRNDGDQRSQRRDCATAVGTSRSTARCSRPARRSTASVRRRATPGPAAAR